MLRPIEGSAAGASARAAGCASSSDAALPVSPDKGSPQKRHRGLNSSLRRPHLGQKTASVAWLGSRCAMAEYGTRRGARTKPASPAEPFQKMDFELRPN